MCEETDRCGGDYGAAKRVAENLVEVGSFRRSNQNLLDVAAAAEGRRLKVLMQLQPEQRVSPPQWALGYLAFAGEVEAALRR